MRLIGGQILRKETWEQKQWESTQHNMTYVSVQGGSFLGAFEKLRKVTAGFIMSVCPSVYLFSWNNLAPNERILMKLDIWAFFEKMSRKFKFN